MKKILLLLGFTLLMFSANAQKTADSSDYVVTIKTKFGDMVLLLYDQTPLHKANFIKLAESGFYDSTSFHRVIEEFMIQGGDPNSKNQDPNDDGQGGPGYTIPAEIRPELKHVKGALAAARLGDRMNPKRESSGSQFYIVHGKDGTPHLDGTYTVFGILIKGQNVLDQIATVPVGQADRPFDKVGMSVSVSKLKVKKIIKLYGAASFYNLPKNEKNTGNRK